MARMYPVRDDAELARLSSTAEARLYRAFRNQLPDDVLVLHGLRTLALGRARRLLQGEADFVVFDPRRGLLVVEAKSGDIVLNEDGIWYGTDGERRQKIDDPFGQARNQMHTVVRQLREDPRWPRDRVVTGYAVFFPDVVEPRFVRPDAQAAMIGGTDDMRDLVGWVERALAAWTGDRPPPPTDFIAIARDRFCMPIDLRRLARTELEEGQEERVRLTDEQAGILRTLGLQPRVAIAGAAGTGKTLLAVRKAEAMARAGLRTLLVCFNRGLADYLKVQCAGVDGLDALGFHELCSWRARVVRRRYKLDLLERARREYPGADEKAVQLPWALLQSTVHSTFRYDAVIVDEGQDFRPEYAAGIEALLRRGEDATLYVFFDPNQALYGRARAFSSMNRPHLLTRNCRNTIAIHDAAYRFYRGEPVDRPPRPGEPVRSLAAPALQPQAARIAEEVRRLIVDEQVTPESIAVLWAGDDKRSAYDALEREPLVAGARWIAEIHRSPGTVVIDTVARFRGLEAPIIFLWGLHGLDRAAVRARAYIGLSRATDRLYLVGTEASIADIGSGGG